MGYRIQLHQFPHFPFKELTVEERERFMRLNTVWGLRLGPGTQKGQKTKQKTKGTENYTNRKTKTFK